VPNKIRLVVFDFDGTLADSQNAILLCMNEAFSKAGLATLSLSQVRRVVGLSLSEAIGTLLGNAADPRLTEELVGYYKRAFLSLRTSPEYEEDLFPGALDCLNELFETHDFLGIATGKAMRGLSASLERYNLVHLFVTLQTADHAPSKPHPAMLERAMAEVGVNPGETVMVGDTVYDMEMARNAGVAGLGVGWGYHAGEDLQKSGAFGLAESFADIPRLLSTIGEV
jgi:phosphoglycolate phosphatase